MKRVVGSLVVRCNHHEDGGGCSWTGELSELDTHIKSCPHNPMISKELLRKNIMDRLKQCEVALREKDRDQSLLRDEIAALKEDNHSLKVMVLRLTGRMEKFEQQLDV